MSDLATTLPGTGFEPSPSSTCRRQEFDGRCAAKPAGFPYEAGKGCLFYAKDPYAELVSERARNAYCTAEAYR
jgi:hypothetical protein